MPLHQFPSGVQSDSVVSFDMLTRGQHQSSLTVVLVLGDIATWSLVPVSTTISHGYFRSSLIQEYETFVLLIITKVHLRARSACRSEGFHVIMKLQSQQTNYSKLSSTFTGSTIRLFLMSAWKIVSYMPEQDGVGVMPYTVLPHIIS